MFLYIANFTVPLQTINEISKQENLEKFKRKNKGNANLLREISKLIDDIETNNWQTPSELRKDRPDSNSVHSDGFYFFNISIGRTMILIEFEEGEASVVWVGNHHDYEKIFKNNKNTIKKW